VFLVWQPCIQNKSVGLHLHLLAVDQHSPSSQKFKYQNILISNRSGLNFRFPMVTDEMVSQKEGHISIQYLFAWRGHSFFDSWWGYGECDDIGGWREEILDEAEETVYGIHLSW